MELPINIIQNCRVVNSSTITSIQTGREGSFYLHFINFSPWCHPFLKEWKHVEAFSSLGWLELFCPTYPSKSRKISKK